MSSAKLSVSPPGVEPVVPLVTGPAEVEAPVVVAPESVPALLEPVVLALVAVAAIPSVAPAVVALVAVAPMVLAPIAVAPMVLAPIVLASADAEPVVTASPPPELPPDEGPLAVSVPSPPEQAAVMSAVTVTILRTGES
jgi:hypothetical protein